MTNLTNLFEEWLINQPLELATRKKIKSTLEAALEPASDALKKVFDDVERETGIYQKRNAFIISSRLAHRVSDACRAAGDVFIVKEVGQLGFDWQTSGVMWPTKTIEKCLCRDDDGNCPKTEHTGHFRETLEITSVEAVVYRHTLTQKSFPQHDQKNFIVDPGENVECCDFELAIDVCNWSALGVSDVNEFVLWLATAHAALHEYRFEGKHYSTAFFSQFFVHHILAAAAAAALSSTSPPPTPVMQDERRPTAASACGVDAFSARKRSRDDSE